MEKMSHLYLEKVLVGELVVQVIVAVSRGEQDRAAAVHQAPDPVLATPPAEYGDR